jgi:hypothetical protein
MNRLQRVFLACGLVGVVCLCLYPPWNYVVTIFPENFDFKKSGVSLTEPLLELPVCKHGWILDPLTSNVYPYPGRHGLRAVGIAFPRLGLEAGGVAGMSAIAVVLAGWRKKARPSN